MASSKHKTKHIDHHGCWGLMTNYKIKFFSYRIETNDVQRFQGGYTQSSSSLSRQSNCFLLVLIDFIENNGKRHFVSFVFMSITARIAESASSKSWHYQTLDDQYFVN